MRSIDIHAHVTPQCFWKATENGGDWHTLKRERDAKGGELAIIGKSRQSLPPKARWTPEERIADMDSLGVEIQVVSTYVGFYNYQLDTPVAVAKIVLQHSKLAVALLGYESRRMEVAPGKWVREFTVRLNTEGADGVGDHDVKAVQDRVTKSINDHINGKTLEEPEFRPFWKAVEQMGAVVFFHQAGETMVAQRSKRYHLPNSIGNLADRAVTFATLVHGGVMDAHPDLKIVLGHGGGYTCYGIGRMDHAWQVRTEARVHTTLPPSAYLRKFYYDCIVYTEPALRFLIDTVGVDRVVFGTDWPYDMALDWPVAWIQGMASLTPEEKEAILWKNLEQLLGI